MAPGQPAGVHSTSKQQSAYLTERFYTLGAITFGIRLAPAHSPLSPPGTNTENEHELHELLRSPSIGHEKAQKCFASAMDMLLTESVRARYGRVPRGIGVTGPSTAELRKWVKIVWAPFVRRILGVILGGNGEAMEVREDAFGEDEVKEWQDVAVQRLGRLRVGQFFDIVVGWPGTRGLVLDVKVCLHNVA